MIVNNTVFRRDIASAVLFLLHNMIIETRPSTSKIATTAGSKTVKEITDVSD